MDDKKKDRGIVLAILVAALGYFVDIYDLILFIVVAKPSLNTLNVTGEELTHVKEMLLNVQMIGLLLGGILWGILGDKKGRLTVLFSSIVIYSIANIANGFIDSVGAYYFWRFVAGVGLAGELGVGITLVSELMSKEKRGYGTSLVAAFGLLGAVVAAKVGGRDWGMNIENWRVAYFVGGGLGLLLLVLRIGVYKSGMFNKLKGSAVSKGNILMLFNNRTRFLKYLNCIIIGIPIWFVIGILVMHAEGFVKELGLPFVFTNEIKADMVMLSYIGLSVGDISSELISQLIKSRKKTVYIFLILTTAFVFYYLNLASVGAGHVKTVTFLLGFSIGYWAIFVTNASEQFGTNIRATVTTTVPNFVRGSLVLMSLSFIFFRDTQGLGFVKAALIVGVIVLLLAFVSNFFQKETFGKDLDYYEEN